MASSVVLLLPWGERRVRADSDLAGRENWASTTDKLLDIPFGFATTPGMKAAIGSLTWVSPTSSSTWPTTSPANGNGSIIRRLIAQVKNKLAKSQISRIGTAPEAGDDGLGLFARPLPVPDQIHARHDVHDVDNDCRRPNGAYNAAVGCATGLQTAVRFGVTFARPMVSRCRQTHPFGCPERCKFRSPFLSSQGRRQCAGI